MGVAHDLQPKLITNLASYNIMMSLTYYNVKPLCYVNYFPYLYSSLHEGIKTHHAYWQVLYYSNVVVKIMNVRLLLLIFLKAISYVTSKYGCADISFQVLFP